MNGSTSGHNSPQAAYSGMNTGWLAPICTRKDFRGDPHPRLRLFCFPHSGAAASIFYSWNRYLPDSIELNPVQYPGRGPRLAEPLYTRLEPLVEALACVLPAYLDIPYAFFGHSLGALLGFELARRLARESIPQPVHLFVSGHPAPHLPATHPPTYDLPESQFVDKLLEMNGMAQEMLQEAELMAMLLPILRADFEVCETYTYAAGPALPCAITALGGLRDLYVTRQGLESWGQHTRGAFAVRVFPGDHFYLKDAQHLLLETIVRTLLPVLSAPLLPTEPRERG